MCRPRAENRHTAPRRIRRYGRHICQHRHHGQLLRLPDADRVAHGVPFKQLPADQMHARGRRAAGDHLPRITARKYAAEAVSRDRHAAVRHDLIVAHHIVRLLRRAQASIFSTKSG